MSLRESRAILGSLLVNVLMAQLLLRPALTDSRQPEQQPPLQYVYSQLASLQDNEDQSTGPQCEHKYIGIGFMYNMLSGEITQVPEHLPAYAAGLRAGDVWVNITPIVSLGQDITVVVHRRGQRLTFHARTQRICYLTEATHA